MLILSRNYRCSFGFSNCNCNFQSVGGGGEDVPSFTRTLNSPFAQYIYVMFLIEASCKNSGACLFQISPVIVVITP